MMTRTGTMFALLALVATVATPLAAATDSLEVVGAGEDLLSTNPAEDAIKIAKPCKYFVIVGTPAGYAKVCLF